MKESRFIELLNLYVDQQLSSAEAAELDAEIERNPARRQTYQQYCRIQKGCTLLFEKERTRAPAHPRLTAALADADRKISAGGSPRKQISWATYFSAGSLAAAACVAAVVALNRAPSAPSSQGGAEIASGQAPAPVAVVSNASVQPSSSPKTETAPAPVVAERPEFYSVLVARSAKDESGEFASAVNSPAPVQNWMENVELMPIASLAEQRITLQESQTAAPESGVLRSRKPVNGEATEMNAFEFQR